MVDSFGNCSCLATFTKRVYREVYSRQLDPSAIGFTASGNWLSIADLAWYRQGFLGNWLYEHFGLVFSFNWKGAVVACVVVALPLMVRSVRLSLDNVDPKLEHAASTLGASPLKVFFTITLPLTIPGIITGTMLSFARSLGEFGATISFVSNIPGETQTIPLAMYNFIETPGAEIEAARLCVISIALALSTLMISEWLNRKAASRLGAKR